jgi:hypothetical protein
VQDDRLGGAYNSNSIAFFVAGYMSSPVICFGQQPCGFFPKRYLVAKIRAAHRLQRQIGGEIVFFYHDSDHDPRETKTTLRHRQSGKPLDYNFEFENKIQRKFSPLYLKRIPVQWHQHMVSALPNYVSKELTDFFAHTPPTTVGDFCLAIYRGMGLLEGVRVIRSADPEFRRAACAIEDVFVDVPWENEIVRARMVHADAGQILQLHEGGPNFITIPAPPEIKKEQISPTRDSRLKWMQSVLHCTHYIPGSGERDYLHLSDAPGMTFVDREEIDRKEEAWTELGIGEL